MMTGRKETLENPLVSILRIDVQILDGNAERSTRYFSSIDEFTGWLREQAAKL